MHTLGAARGVEILRSQPKGEGIRMNTNITKAQTTTEATATEISAKAQAITEKYHISGTIEAAAQLVEELGGEVVKLVFMMELAGLKGRDRLAKYDVESAIVYEGK